MSWRLALWFLILQLVGAGVAEARVAMVRANGQAVISKGNAQVAEAQAAAIVYRNAVEQIATSLGGPRHGDDTLIDQLLYDRAGSFVAHSILVHRRTSGATLQLELLVEVRVTAVQELLWDKRPQKKTTDRASLQGASWVCASTRRGRDDGAVL